MPCCPDLVNCASLIQLSLLGSHSAGDHVERLVNKSPHAVGTRIDGFSDALSDLGRVRLSREQLSETPSAPPISLMRVPQGRFAKHVACGRRFLVRV